VEADYEKVPASFGELVRYYRRQGKDPMRGGLLTQERLGELIGLQMGDAGYSGAVVSEWERGKSKIHTDDLRWRITR
jgi:transcriptional regulator with XRE-family HTH domain